MGDTQPDPLNLFFLERDYVKEGMNIYVLGFPAEHLRDGKHCTRCLEAPKKLYTCAKCKNPIRLYCSKECQKLDWWSHKNSCGKQIHPLEESVSCWLHQYSQVAALAQQRCGKPHIVIHIVNRHPTRQTPGPPFRVSHIEKFSHLGMSLLVEPNTGPLRHAQSASVRYEYHPKKPPITIVMPVELDLTAPMNQRTQELIPYWEPGFRIISTLDLPNLNHKQLHSSWRILNRKLMRLREEAHGGWSEARIMELSHFKELKPDDWTELQDVNDFVDPVTGKSAAGGAQTPMELLLQSRALVGRWFRDEMVIYAKENNIKIEGEMHAIALALKTYKTLLL